MVKLDPEHTKQILELSGWGQHPDKYHQCVSTNAVPWLVSPHWLQDEGKLFPSVVQMVATLPVLHTLVDLHDPLWRPPPSKIVRKDDPEPDVPADPSLYNVCPWRRRRFCPSLIHKSRAWCCPHGPCTICHYDTHRICIK